MTCPPTDRQHSDESKVRQQSKRALKRLAKRQKWEDSKTERRRKEKERRKRRRLASQDDSASSTSASKACWPPSRKALRGKTMSQSLCRIHIVIDLQFADRMTDAEASKCAKQILRCYSTNRRLDHPVQYHISSSGKMAPTLQKYEGRHRWDIWMHDEEYHLVNFANCTTEFAHDKNNDDEEDDHAVKRQQITRLCYLTSESDNVLDGPLSPDCAYIIGGLVDHNRMKGLSFRAVNEQIARRQTSSMAEDKGRACRVLELRHARLPLDRYVKMNGRRVLTIDHVFEMLALVAQESVALHRLSRVSDADLDIDDVWRQAIHSTVPQRKISADKPVGDTAHQISGQGSPTSQEAIDT